ncbi:class I SAM-dependent methyltransferase [Corynebacterium epidermidicanis]|uniref:Methyltransferase domain n=1 Tax=Corynebacterium epidermidicanis TaxID=1050174 RepID=A0A0G3GW51_9CORY|nr:class I SAM-dependent methyltransferase [Corynebacterium epidermidicanis]AKK03097.1 Methyltransferase domain [Corynebacterium epidermidicanis]
MPTWKDIVARNPQHSANYAQRWKDFVAAGQDINGEARFLDALAPRGARILDAGCGTGRVGGELARRGHEVTGVDVDAELLSHAKTDFPETNWVLGDLATGNVPAGPFDVVFTAGNVLTFLEPAERPIAIAALADVMAEDARMVMGFGTQRGYHFRQFLADAAAAGLKQELLLGTWDIRPFTPKSDFLVAVLHR